MLSIKNKVIDTNDRDFLTRKYSNEISIKNIVFDIRGDNMLFVNILVVAAIVAAVVLAFIEDTQESHHKSEW